MSFGSLFVKGKHTELDDNNTLTSGTHGVTGTLVGNSDSQTLTNKVIAAANNVISGLTASNISSLSGVVPIASATSDIGSIILTYRELFLDKEIIYLEDCFTCDTTNRYTAIQTSGAIAIDDEGWKITITQAADAYYQLKGNRKFVDFNREPHLHIRINTQYAPGASDNFLVGIYDNVGANLAVMGIKGDASTTKFTYFNVGTGYAASAVDLDTGWHDIDICVQADRTVKYYVDNILIGTSTGAIPANQTAPVFVYVSNNNTATRVGYINNIWVKQKGYNATPA